MKITFMNFLNFFRSEKKLMNQFPLLRSLENSNPFLVPENYFQQFENNILQHIKSIPSSHQMPAKPLLPPTGHSLIPYFIAASLISIVALYFIFHQFLYTEPVKPVSEPIVYFQINTTLSENKPFITHLSEDNRLIIIDVHPDHFPQFISRTPFASHPVAQQALNFCEKFQDFISSQTPEVSIVAQQYPSKKPSTIEHSPVISSSQPLQVTGSEQTFTQKDPDNIYNHQITNTNVIQQLPTASFQLPYFALPEEICSETPFELKPSINVPNLKYHWSTGEETYSIFVKESGIYTLTISQPDNPEYFTIHTTRVKIIPKPKLPDHRHAVLCSGKTLELNPDIPDEHLYQYFWLSTYDTTKSTVVHKPGLHILAITGCQTYFDTILVTREHCDILIPNVITPNNDGINDIFYINGLERHPYTQLTVYSRTGMIVYDSKNYQNDWRAENVPSGMYYYILRFADGIEMHGNLTILR